MDFIGKKICANDALLDSFASIIDTENALTYYMSIEIIFITILTHNERY